MIAIFMPNLKNYFLLKWENPIFWGGAGRRIGLKIENAPNPGMLRDNISSSP